jgi:hypothetical protein
MILIINPALACVHFLSIIIAITPKKSANGALADFMNPPRIPSDPPHPKPKHPTNSCAIIIHDRTDNTILICPNSLDFTAFISLKYI